MAIRFACPLCNTRITAPEPAAGRKAKCLRCSTVVTVPVQAGQPLNDPLPSPNSHLGVRGLGLISNGVEADMASTADGTDEIRFTCPVCGDSYGISPELSEKAIRCR